MMHIGSQVSVIEDGPHRAALHCLPALLLLFGRFRLLVDTCDQRVAHDEVAWGYILAASMAQTSVLVNVVFAGSVRWVAIRFVGFVHRLSFSCLADRALLGPER